jgi:hypothetical protein
MARVGCECSIVHFACPDVLADFLARFSRDLFLVCFGRFRSCQFMSLVWCPFHFGFQCIPWTSSVPWETTAIPLFFVLACTGAKDGWDDWVGLVFSFWDCPLISYLTTFFSAPKGPVYDWPIYAHMVLCTHKCAHAHT